ncbi:MAG: glycosyltransferase family 1 protein, partial [Dehalococcoidia bacterium]|nr:glycosyltransferase family 1 protein [Dehalococcoidia bacterium]
KDRHLPQTPSNFLTRSLWTPCHHRWEQVALPAELSLARLDVLHSPDFIPPLHRRCRSVITVHDLAFLHFPELLTEEARRYYGQIYLAVESADAIIAVSENTKNDLVKMAGATPGKVHIVFEAPAGSYHQIEPGAGGMPASVRSLAQPFLLFVGTLEPRKNLSVLLHAMGLIKADRGGRTPLLVIAGNKGWLYQDTLDLIGTLNLSGETLLFGPASPEELLWLYNRAEAMVLPSMYEGFGLPVIEAMACGTPVITTNVSSLPEVAGEAAILVDPHDSDGLAAAISRVLDDPNLRARMREAGLAQSSHFDWDSTARATVEVYREASLG